MTNISIAMPSAKIRILKNDLFLFMILLWIMIPGVPFAQSASPVMVSYDSICMGAERTDQYLPYLKDKRVAVVANHSSMIKDRHLVDTLLSMGVGVTRIFSPEHGFRGDHADGAHISDGKDPSTGIPVVSLYGKKKKPGREDMRDIDIVVYDIQDVGVRFYTFISTMTLVMEACAEHGIPFVILDRPNPNGFYIDGPVLDTAFSSFVGMHPVPIVYGMTPGEYAGMVCGEGWLMNGKKPDLTVISMTNYRYEMTFELPAAPSPNLPNWAAVYLYPSLALFEGTIISVGRGTDMPFQVIGHPDYMLGSFVFTPTSLPGKSTAPPYEGVTCYGSSLAGVANRFRQNEHHFHLRPLLSMYDYFKGRTSFFNDYFDKLAGTGDLRIMILQGRSEDQIRGSWEKDHAAFREIRDKYLLYRR